MNLTEQQLKSIELLSSGMAQKDVAQAIGTTPRTLQRWSKLPEYREATKQAKSEKATIAIKQATDEKPASTPISVVQQPLTRDQTREQMRLAQNNILNELQLTMIPKALDGDIRAVNCLLKIMDYQSNLFGLKVSAIPILRAVEVLLMDHLIGVDHAQIISDSLAELERKMAKI